MPDDLADVTDDLCPGFGRAAPDDWGFMLRGCRPAPTCSAALTQASARWPGRNRASDGICGDAAHAARQSDHNPDASGYAHAWDLTHDPGKGLDTHRLADQLRLHCKGVGMVRRAWRRLRGRTVPPERRVKYIISNRRIASGPSWAWRSYGGANPHSAHMHVSVTAAATPDTSPWFAFLDGDSGLTAADRATLVRAGTDLAVVKTTLG